MLMSKGQRVVARKLHILRHSEESCHVPQTCRYFDVGRRIFYRCREAYHTHIDPPAIVLARAPGRQ